MAQEFKITAGAKYSVLYRVSTTQAERFEGVYKGLSVIASDTALVFDVDGRIRFLNALLVSMMDELEPAPEEPAKKESPADSVFYG